MKETAVEKLLEFFIKKEKEGCSHWCIHDLIAWLYISKEMEKEQIIDAWNDGYREFYDGSSTPEEYYNQTFKSE
jgi:hypothetical protein